MDTGNKNDRQQVLPTMTSYLPSFSPIAANTTSRDKGKLSVWTLLVGVFRQRRGNTGTVIRLLADETSTSAQTANRLQNGEGWSDSWRFMDANNTDKRGKPHCVVGDQAGT